MQHLPLTYQKRHRPFPWAGYLLAFVLLLSACRQEPRPTFTKERDAFVRRSAWELTNAFLRDADSLGWFSQGNSQQKYDQFRQKFPAESAEKVPSLLDSLKQFADKINWKLLSELVLHPIDTSESRLIRETSETLWLRDRPYPQLAHLLNGVGETVETGRNKRAELLHLRAAKARLIQEAHERQLLYLPAEQSVHIWLYILLGGIFIVVLFIWIKKQREEAERQRIAEEEARLQAEREEAERQRIAEEEARRKAAEETPPPLSFSSTLYFSYSREDSRWSAETGRTEPAVASTYLQFSVQAEGQSAWAEVELWEGFFGQEHHFDAYVRQYLGKAVEFREVVLPLQTLQKGRASYDPDSKTWSLTQKVVAGKPAPVKKT